MQTIISIRQVERGYICQHNREGDFYFFPTSEGALSFVELNMGRIKMNIKEEELNEIKIVLLALWDKSPHPEAQEIIKKYRDEMAREEK